MPDNKIDSFVLGILLSSFVNTYSKIFILDYLYGFEFVILRYFKIDTKVFSLSLEYLIYFIKKYSLEKCFIIELLESLISI